MSESLEKDIAWLINSTVEDLESCMKQNDQLRKQLAAERKGRKLAEEGTKMSNPTPRSEPWTVETIWNDFSTLEGGVKIMRFREIADAHNAALAAQREELVICKCAEANAVLREQLDAAVEALRKLAEFRRLKITPVEDIADAALAKINKKCA